MHVSAGAAQVTTVYAVSTRGHKGSDPLAFDASRAHSIIYTAFRVSLPPNRKPGQIDWPVGKPDPAKTIAVLDSTVLSEHDFLSRISKEAKSSNGEATLFVHGYNQSFQEALFRLAQLNADSGQNSPAILFSWPSQANVAGYVADRDSVAYSRDYLTRTLSNLSQAKSVQKTNVLAHSMGSLLTVEALRQIRLTKQDPVLNRLQIALAAPDIDIDVFQAQMDVIGPMKNPMVVFVSRDDRALQVSRSVAGDHERLGTIDVRDPKVDAAASRYNIAFIDISSINTDDPLRHGRYAMLGTLYAQLRNANVEDERHNQLQKAGAFVFNTLGATLASPFELAAKAFGSTD